MTIIAVAGKRSPKSTSVTVVIDHLVFATLDPQRMLTRFADEYGIVAVEGGRHEGFGTRNWLAHLGPTTYLEILAADPDQPNPTARRPFGFDQILTGQEPDGRLVAWCARANSPLGAVRKRLTAAGFDYGSVDPMSRATPAGEILEWELMMPTNPLALRAGVPFFIDWGSTQHPTAGLAEGPALIELRLPDHHQLLPLALVETGGDLRISVTDRVLLMTATIEVNGVTVAI